MPEIISGGMGFGGMRLNGQIIHYKGLRDTQSVIMPGLTDVFAITDENTVSIPAFLDSAHFMDIPEADSIQAQAVEVLATTGGIYSEVESIAFSDSASET